MLKTITCLLLCCLLVCSSSFAQSAGETAIASRVESLKKAMIAADATALAELTAQELSYGHSNGLVEDKKAFIDQFITGKSVFKSIELSAQTIKVTGDAAIVRHRLTGDTNNSNVAGKVDLFVLLVWQKQHGQWKLLARQAVKVPVQ